MSTCAHGKKPGRPSESLAAPRRLSRAYSIVRVAKATLDLTVADPGGNHHELRIVPAVVSITHRGGSRTESIALTEAQEEKP